MGRLLLDELRCDACHAGIAPGLVPAAAPDLSEVGGRVDPAYLERFLADPAGTRPGTKMPGLLHVLPAGERAEAARALTHFLVDLSTVTWAGGAALEDEIGAGSDLFHTVGCVACHPPRRPASENRAPPAASAGAVDLSHVPAKYGLDSLAAFLFQPLRARPGGRMPDLWLTRAESRSIASFLIGAGAPSSPALDVRPELVEAGRRYFERLSCSACHELAGLRPPVKGPDATGLDPKSGCLAEGETDAPRFHLDESQRRALARALEARADGSRGEPTDDERIARTLVAFDCIACHVRDDYGGVRPELDAYFRTSEPDLGDDARIPPRLTLVGAKLQGPWLRKVLFENGNLRDYMLARMPRFGEANLAHLPALLERADGGEVEPFAMPLPEGEEARVARDAGRELMGIRGLGCIACHDFNGTPSPTHEGIDLIDAPVRLQPSWFARFLLEPQTYRPGVVMPESWSGGVAAHQGILDGDTDAQIRALWFYLSEGRTARDPEGIHPVRSRLTVAGTTRTYRGRSSVAGFRGIAVGFPGGLSYAFNAQTGTLSALWSGDFVSVRWDGQGAGGFDPLARAVLLAQDVSFCRLADDDAPWPLRPRVDDENPVNPDPLYPRNHGYRFLGYRLDESSIPTLRYASDETSIEDRSEADTSGERPVLRRTLRFSPPTPEGLFFRALAGELEQVGERVYRTPGLRVTLPAVPTVLRGERDGRPAELLLHLPAGSTHLTIDYELSD